MGRLISTGMSHLKSAMRSVPWSHFIIMVLFCLVGVWSYWPAVLQMVGIWSTVDDYSHAFLVPPLAAFIFWSRRNSRPQVVPSFEASGLILIGAAALLKLAAGKYF